MDPQGKRQREDATELGALFRQICSSHMKEQGLSAAERGVLKAVLPKMSKSIFGQVDRCIELSSKRQKVREEEAAAEPCAYSIYSDRLRIVCALTCPALQCPWSLWTSPYSRKWRRWRPRWTAWTRQ